MCDYKTTKNCVVSAKIIIDLKTQRRDILLKKYHISYQKNNFRNPKNIQWILLYEARTAKSFWKHFRLLLPEWCYFKGRKAKSMDIVNSMLDIGYHHITNITKKILNNHDISPALGILHKANRTNGAPLAYDLVEIFRADTVETEVLNFLRLKKKPITGLSQKHIAQFIGRINKRVERKYFLREFKQCHTYKYYMELQIFKFIKAVNHKLIFSPLKLPSRHEKRC